MKNICSKVNKIGNKVLEVVQFGGSIEHILNGTSQLYKSANGENIEAGKQQFAQIFLHHFCNVRKRKKKANSYCDL